MVFCDPVSTEGMAPRDMDTLSARVRQEMAEVYYSQSDIAVQRWFTTEAPKARKPWITEGIQGRAEQGLTEYFPSSG